MIDKDEFDAWKDSEITQAVFRFLERKQGEAKRVWTRHSWEQGTLDPVILAELRAKSDVMGEIMDLAFEDIEESNEQERSG